MAGDSAHSAVGTELAQGNKNPACSFDHHDSSGAARIHDTYDVLRRNCPVAWSERHGGFWVVTDYQGVHDLALEPQRFSSSAPFIPDVLNGAALLPISLDPPEHSKYRVLLQRWFSTARLATFEPFIRDRARQLLENLDSPSDLASEFALPLPLAIVLRVIGIDDDGLDPVASAARFVIENTGADPQGAFAAMTRAHEYVLSDVIPKLQQRPGDDLVSFLLQSEVDGTPIAPATIATMAFNIVGAGFDTTYKTLATSMGFFATDLEAQASARRSDDRGAVVEELLRLFSPVSIGRKVTEDTDYRGIRMQAGDAVLLAFPAAGRDETVFPRASEADFARKENRHLAFGAGIHRCLGMHLARLELRVALDELFAAIPTFALAEGAAIAYSGSQAWGATSVPVTFSGLGVGGGRVQ